MSSDTTKEQPSPEVWEAQQQELARLARLVEQLERMNQELRFAGEARAKQDREEYTIADVLTADKDALLKLATDENETLRARVAELEAQVAWRTIDTAPLFDAEGEERVIVCGGRHKKPVTITPDGEWWRIEAARGSKAVPTHWMSMPDAPESPRNAPSLPQEPPVPVSAGDSSHNNISGIPAPYSSSGHAVTWGDCTFGVGLPESVPIPSPLATLCYWAYWFRRSLRDSETLLRAWGEYRESEPDRGKRTAVFVKYLPIEARRVIMEANADDYLKATEEATP